MFKTLQWYFLTHAKEDGIQLIMMGQAKSGFVVRQRDCAHYLMCRKKSKRRSTEKVVQRAQQKGKY